MEKKTEEWRRIPQHKLSDLTHYFANPLLSEIIEVSSEGRIRNTKTGHLYKPTFSQGAMKVMLPAYRFGPEAFRLMYRVSHLVIAAFRPECKIYGLPVAHADGDPKNCRLDNLIPTVRREDAKEALAKH